MSVSPEDILSDGVDSTTINGVVVRKGTVAAFLQNIDCLVAEESNAQEREAALSSLQALAPAVVATGLHKHVVFKNQQVEQMLRDICS